jgi:hypothetical protein
VLHDNLHLEEFNLRYVPHSLKANQRRWRVKLFREPLQILEHDQQYEFERILTGDKSWFFFDYFHHLCWAANPDDALEIPKQKIQSKKCLNSIIWGGPGIESLLFVSKGMKYNTTFFVESVVPDLVEHVCRESRRKMLRGIMVDLHNALPHDSRKSDATLTATKARRTLPQLTVQIHLRAISSSLKCSRSECREHHTARQMN